MTNLIPSRVGGWVDGENQVNDHLSPTEAGTGTELGIEAKNSTTYLWVDYTR